MTTMTEEREIITEEERGIITEILEHAEKGTTHMLPEVMSNPVSKYTDPAQLDAEVQTLFRNFPIVVAHCSELPEPGDFVTVDHLGPPILVTRNHDGQVRAFYNVCRHRGARVESKPCGKARTFSCPYHSWTYDLNGKLRGIPQQEGFAGVDKSKHGLVELPAEERFGMIWVVPSPQEQAVDFDAWFAPMQTQLDSLGLDTHVIYKKWTLDRNMSWRLALEGFQESYHFCHAHRDTACAGYLDNQSVHLDFGPHVRHAVPLPKVQELRDADPADWTYRPYFMTQNYLFPANFFQVMTDHVYIHTIIPTGPGTCIFNCMLMIPEAPATEKAERYWAKNYSLIRTVFEEDFVIGEDIQKNFATGANENFLFGTFECGLQFGQQAIDAALRGELKVPVKAA
ncbi:aromatic ring-hydroxylating oxygenase subunit alpha [Rhodovulum sp. DZ06]|uniref:aromatic ring-hydroxylating oxygenase subunit alpha n=1 Tax=Rhodovulum sp. DZ06 TaxID=3425126 RepID=UPI003D3436C4